MIFFECKVVLTAVFLRRVLKEELYVVLIYSVILDSKTKLDNDAMIAPICRLKWVFLEAIFCRNISWAAAWCIKQSTQQLLTYVSRFFLLLWRRPNLENNNHSHTLKNPVPTLFLTFFVKNIYYEKMPILLQCDTSSMAAKSRLLICIRVKLFKMH